MPTVAPPSAPPPARRPDLVISRLGERGSYVIKDPVRGSYYRIGEQEWFLLQQLDGRRPADAVCQAFGAHFGAPLAEEDLRDFVALAEARGFLCAAGPGAPAQASPARARGRPGLGQRLLCWRKPLFDPDRLFGALEPRLRWVWTKAFFLSSAALVVGAGMVLAMNAAELARSWPRALHWETLALAWVTVFAVTTLHEFAHGLTCRHHGGEVHEVGFLLLFLMPCLYCNVSDAWLFREKSKRLWVTLAGGYADLVMWALAVFAWRLAEPDGLPHYLAWVVLTVCGGRALFNFNPLLKLDGYYLLSDWLEVPNLRQKGLGRLAAHVRRLLWGSPRPAAEPLGRRLLAFGLAGWVFSLAFLAVMLRALAAFAWPRAGLLGFGAVAVMGLVLVRPLFEGFCGGEVRTMLRRRVKRTVVWLVLLGGAAAALYLVPIEDRAGGSFQVWAVTRAEVRAPMAGFLEAVYCDEGDRVSPGAALARLGVPDLASRIAVKQAEVREARAKLRLLELGARPEELARERGRVARARARRDQAVRDLARAEEVRRSDLARLEQQVRQYRAEADFADAARKRSERLYQKQVVPREVYEDSEKNYKVALATLRQAEAEKHARLARGTVEAEAELSRWKTELAEAEAALALLEAGSPPEQVEAQRAHVASLQEESRYLQGLQGRMLLGTGVPGLVAVPRQPEGPFAKVLGPAAGAGAGTGPHLRERVGHYFREGELICVVEEPAVLEAEVIVAEEEVAGVEPGQRVLLKARALPFETFPAKVVRVAPGSLPGESQNAVAVYCRVDGAPAGLRPGMSGYGRIYTCPCSLGEFLARRALRFLRTEFWWAAGAG